MLRVRAESSEWCHDYSVLKIGFADLKGLEKFGAHVDRRGRISVEIARFAEQQVR